jgi:hypothetical protein
MKICSTILITFLSNGRGKSICENMTQLKELVRISSYQVLFLTLKAGRQLHLASELQSSQAHKISLAK